MMSMSMNESSKGRPFFRSPNDLYDDEYYDEFYPEKKRRLTHDQVRYIFLYSTMLLGVLSISLCRTKLKLWKTAEGSNAGEEF